MRILSGSCALTFGILATLLLAAGVKEVRVGYGQADAVKSFKLLENMEGPVLMSYSIPFYMGNYRSMIDSKDTAVWSSMISGYNCEKAETAEDVKWRRPDDEHFQALLGNQSSFRPCGLSALTMFTDDYELYDVSRQKVVELNEDNIALAADEALYDNIVPAESGGLKVVDEKEGTETPSWLLPGRFLEHFKVWYRSSAAPTVRNLWATIPGGLQAGDYELRLLVNSPVWTKEYQVSEKEIVLTEEDILGSPAASTLVGVFCLLICVGNLGAMLALIMAPGLSAAKA
eukprot:TRINITY_DN95804_c0_g1_i1.p1 TRINITY_DN95804_c0_g1~~TRINITY_DN95804_c0_g1_i1.p1  ORF type:complete len:287 (+),score=64.92 TRINITY_DN95804_c0_g1_i1:475-1335(+)